MKSKDLDKFFKMVWQDPEWFIPRYKNKESFSRLTKILFRFQAWFWTECSCKILKSKNLDKFFKMIYKILSELFQDKNKKPFQDFTGMILNRMLLQALESKKSWQVVWQDPEWIVPKYKNEEYFSRFYKICFIFRHNSEQNAIARSWKAKILTSFSKWSNKILSESFQDIKQAILF